MQKNIFNLHIAIRELFKTQNINPQIIKLTFFHSIRYYYPKHNRPDTPEGLQDNINRHFECLVAVIDDVVRSLPDISSHLAFLRKLGTMHADVEIQQRLLELMGPVFCNTVRPLLLVQGKWSFRVMICDA